MLAPAVAQSHAVSDKVLPSDTGLGSPSLQVKVISFIRLYIYIYIYIYPYQIF